MDFSDHHPGATSTDDDAARTQPTKPAAPLGDSVRDARLRDELDVFLAFGAFPFRNAITKRGWGGGAAATLALLVTAFLTASPPRTVRHLEKRRPPDPGGRRLFYFSVFGRLMRCSRMAKPMIAAAFRPNRVGAKSSNPIVALRQVVFHLWAKRALINERYASKTMEKPDWITKAI